MAQAFKLLNPLLLTARAIPSVMHSVIISRLLNHMLSTQIDEDELDFLRGKHCMSVSKTLT